MNHFFLLLCKWGRQQEERRGDYQNSLDEGMVFQVVSCNPTVPFISGTVCSSNPFIFFLTEVSVICSILKLHLNGFFPPHVLAFSLSLPRWTDPRPSIFFPLKEWMGANFLFKHPPLPTFCKGHLGSFPIPEAICGGLTLGRVKQFLCSTEKLRRSRWFFFSRLNHHISKFPLSWFA